MPAEAVYVTRSDICTLGFVIIMLPMASHRPALQYQTTLHICSVKEGAHRHMAEVCISLHVPTKERVPAVEVLHR